MKTEDIPGWMLPPELAVLQAAASRLAPGSTWVEVGVFCGRSAHAVGLALPRHAKLYLVDRFRQDYDPAILPCKLEEIQPRCHAAIADLAIQRPDVSVVLKKMTSEQAASELAGPFSVVFIDADHSMTGVLKDCCMWEKKSSILMGHDYHETNWPGVVAAVRQKYPHRASVFPDTAIWRVDT